MIEKSLYEHLIAQKEPQQELADCLACYNCRPAIFSQEAPADADEGWCGGPQYGRIVFAVDLQGDPERDVAATLAVDILCSKDDVLPEEIEPMVKDLIDGWFFSGEGCIMAAQWKNSSYFTEPTNQVAGCTVVFDLLALPLLSTGDPDVIQRINEWTAQIEGLHVLNYDALPASAWKPSGEESAVYWRLVNDGPAGWVKDTYQTIWRKAIIKCHVFSESIDTASAVTRDLYVRLYAARRLLKAGESPIMVNQKNSADYGADPLRTGQLTVEATYGIIVRFRTEKTLEHITSDEKKGDT